MDEISRLLGGEHDLGEVSRALRNHVQAMQPPVVGAMLLTCSDESELECTEAFQHAFVSNLLPGLKLWNKSAFRLANLGGRYEWGAMSIVDDHFTTSEAQHEFKVIVVKINAHVAYQDSPQGPIFGRLDRYHRSSAACGALHALLDGVQQPFVQELTDMFESEGIRRLAILRDADRVDPAKRCLFAALASVRLQARNAILDIQDKPPKSPTYFLVVPCVTINRHGPDTEIVCGVYRADQRSKDGAIEYHGLGDDPSKYRVDFQHGRMHVEDESLQVTRPARNHRKLVGDAWKKRRSTKPPARDRRLERILAEANQHRHHQPKYSRVMLEALVAILAELSPVSVAVALFAEGAVAIYHTHRAHRLACGLAGDYEARRILADFRDGVSQLPHERAVAVIDVLLRDFRTPSKDDCTPLSS